MKLRRRHILLLFALALALLLAGYAMATAEPGAQPEQTPECRYFYQITREDPGTGNARYSLYVERTDAEAAPLHGGSITLTASIPNHADLSFTAAEGWVITSAKYNGVTDQVEDADGMDVGTMPDDLSGDLRYLSFSWRWGDGQAPSSPPENSVGNPQGGTGGSARRQYLGYVDIPWNIDATDIFLQPWVETPAGKKQLRELSQAADPEAAREILENVWRIEDFDTLAAPSEGFYQGFYAGEDETEPEGTQYPTDLTAGWYGFIVGGYAPMRPATLTVYEGPEVVATAEISFKKTTPGYFKEQIDLNALEFKKPDGQPWEGPDGTYTLELTKLSHVPAMFQNVTISQEHSKLFPELLGLTVILPCGDVDLNGQITQRDRALLTDPDGYYQNVSKANDGTKERYDLDGDAKVNQVDMAIQLAPANYGKKTLKYNFH